MDNPKVSIIVPIYRVEEYIERCAESLFAQTFDDIEYIFVDDCSPDKSVEILQRTLEKYPHRKRLTRIERFGFFIHTYIYILSRPPLALPGRAGRRRRPPAPPPPPTRDSIGLW